MKFLSRNFCIFLMFLITFQPSLLLAANKNLPGMQLILLLSDSKNEFAFIPTENSQIPAIARVSINNRHMIWTPYSYNQDKGTDQAVLFDNDGNMVVIGFTCDFDTSDINSIAAFRPSYININNEVIIRIQNIGRDTASGNAPYLMAEYESNSQKLGTLEIRENPVLLEQFISSCENNSFLNCWGVLGLVQQSDTIALDQSLFDPIDYMKQVYALIGLIVGVTALVLSAPLVMGATGIYGVIGEMAWFLSMLQTCRDAAKLVLGENYNNDTTIDKALDFLKEGQGFEGDYNCTSKAIQLLLAVIKSKYSDLYVLGDCVGTLLNFINFAQDEGYVQ